MTTKRPVITKGTFAFLCLSFGLGLVLGIWSSQPAVSALESQVQIEQIKGSKEKRLPVDSMQRALVYLQEQENPTKAIHELNDGIDRVLVTETKEYREGVNDPGPSLTFEPYDGAWSQTTSNIRNHREKYPPPAIGTEWDTQIQSILGTKGPVLVEEPETDSEEEPQATSQQQESPAIVKAARDQVGKTTIYDGAYVSLGYPGGDVSIERGVCTDVVIRALRDAHKMDLQQLVHEDMKSAFSQYPNNWGLTKPDKNIDHRRVPNLQTYFERQGYSLKITKKADDYLPGDLVTCNVGNRPHIMVVSDNTSKRGVPLVIHNIGSGTKEENHLFTFKLTGHYRVKKS